MPLILNGSGKIHLGANKIAYIEIYQKEAYTIPIFIKDRNLTPIDCTDPDLWKLSVTAKWYKANVSYAVESPRAVNPEEADVSVHYPERPGALKPISIEVEALEYVFPQPKVPEELIVEFTNPEFGEGFIYIPENISSRTEATTPKLEDHKGWIGLNDRNSKELIINPVLLVVVTTTIERTNKLSGLKDINREPLGIIIRYQ